MEINEKKLEQYFLNNFDCYADADEVIPALTLNKAVKLITEFLNENEKCYTVTDLQDAFNAGIDRGFDKIDIPTLNMLGEWNSNMFDEYYFSKYENKKN